jgi:Asp-tRNA(Asn)/Glu-tRNA(Gln) amidotransferase A subunit family amidase
MSRESNDLSGAAHQLTVTEAVAAIKEGVITSENYVLALLSRYKKLASLNAFITVNADMALEAAFAADKERASGKTTGPLHGVPVGIKDSMCTADIPTSFGTKVLSNFQPKIDADVVSALRSAGAIIFAKNNLVEMSYGLTGSNDHYGHVSNPYDVHRASGGSSSGAGASVAARLVPAALGGDTVGSIRVPASFCGIVGFRPTTGRWSGHGVAPISHTLDTPGPMARSVEDCALLDSIVTKGPLPAFVPGSLKGIRLGYAPKQHLDLIDVEIERLFHETLLKLKSAGAEIVQIDLGDDFASLAEKANWPIFFHETEPHVTEFLQMIRAPATFREVYNDLNPGVKVFWSDAVVEEGPNYIPNNVYLESLNLHRPALAQCFTTVFDSTSIDAIIFPTTPLVAPPLNTDATVIIAGQSVSAINIAKNAFPSSCAGLPGITLPMGLSSNGMPIGLELDGRLGDDARILGIAARVSALLGKIPPPDIV